MKMLQITLHASYSEIMMCTLHRTYLHTGASEIIIYVMRRVSTVIKLI